MEVYIYRLDGGPKLWALAHTRRRAINCITRDHDLPTARMVRRGVYQTRDNHQIRIRRGEMSEVALSNR